MRVVTSVCTYSTRESGRNIDYSALEPDRQQHDRASACVIAQQYSSATFVSCFRSREEKFGEFSTKMLLFPFLLTFSKTVRSCSTLNWVSRRVYVSSYLFSKPVTCLVTSCSMANVALLSKDVALPAAPSQSRRYSVQVNPPPIQLRDPVAWIQITHIRPTEFISRKRTYCHLNQKSLG